MLIRAISPELVRPSQSETAFWLGLAFIIVGAITSAYSAWQYAVVLRTLTPAEFPSGYATKWGIAVNFAVAVLGIILALSLLSGFILSEVK